MTQDVDRDPPASLGSGAKCRPIGAYVHTPAYDDLLAEIDRLRLTDAEREAIKRLGPCGDPLASRTVTLTPEERVVFHGLLERMG